MDIDWLEVKKELGWLKSYDDLAKHWQESVAYPFVRLTYDYTMPAMTAYTKRMLGEDTRQRYTGYCQQLVEGFTQLANADVKGIIDLVTKVDSMELFEAFTAETGIPATETINVLKYLIYWFIPAKKYSGELVRGDETIKDAIKFLHTTLGLRSNLDILQRGLTAANRQSLVEESGLPPEIIAEVVNRADFSRMPWASKATISNIIGAGYGSIAALAAAEPEKLFADFYAYGERIGKNLKSGNEIESSQRVAKIIPAVLS